MMRNRRVVVALNGSHKWQRDVARGVGIYAERKPHWECHFTLLERAIGDSVLRSKSADGLIIDTVNAWMAANVKIPVVIAGDPMLKKFPFVSPDVHAMGQMAAAHMVERGFRRFAYFAFDGAPPGLEEGRVFGESIERRGYDFEWLQVRLPKRNQMWFSDHAQLKRWISQTAKPVAIFCRGDPAALLLAMACQAAGVAVPEDVAILGSHNDELRCRLCKPEISSIEIGAERIGVEAAKMLDGFMEGRAGPRSVIVPPVRVVVRDSTDIVTTTDSHVKQAVRFIDENLAAGVSVKQLIQRMPVSRRTLELAFRHSLGRTIHREIVRAQVQRATRLLEGEDITVSQIAQACGVRRPTQFSKLFKKEIGMSPIQYRRKHQ